MKTVFHKNIAVLSALVAAAMTSPLVAQAATMEELSAAAEETSAAYDAAVAERDRIQGEIDVLQEQITAKENELPGYQDKANSAAVSLYKIGNERSVLIEMLLDSNSLQNAIEIWNTYEKTISHYSDCIKANNDLRTSLSDDKTKLEEERAAAQVAVDETEATMKAAESARVAGQAQMVAQAASAVDAARASEINWSMSKEDFVAEWGQRIDTYLAGRPLCGYGNVFAEAAWENSNDPRFQVAISVIESGAGRACFASYNPFGWMSRSFSSWEEAIYAHAAYISGPIYKTNGYLTRSFASTYCPPNAENWYNNVSNEMAKI